MAAICGNDRPQSERVVNMRVGVSEHVYCCLYVCIKECGYVCVAVCTPVYTRYTSICMPVCIYPHAVGMCGGRYICTQGDVYMCTGVSVPLSWGLVCVCMHNRET